MKGRALGAAVSLLLVAGVAGFVAWSPVVTPATAAVIRGALVDASPAPTLAPGAIATYTVRFRNSGLGWSVGVPPSGAAHSPRTGS